VTAPHERQTPIRPKPAQAFQRPLAVSWRHRAGQLAQPAQNLGMDIFETRFPRGPINTGMTQDHSPPPSSTSTGFISLPFPPIQRPISSEFSLAPIVATRSQRRAVQAYWGLLRRLLSGHGHPASLDRIAYDPDEGWRIHFLAADPELVVAMHKVAGEENGPGDLSAFDAHDRVSLWLRRIEDRIVYSLGDGSLVECH
jgi:hypothetical protein